MKNDNLTNRLVKPLTEQIMPMIKNEFTKKEVQNKIIKTIEKSNIKAIEKSNTDKSSK